jgi:hypothetical protein
MLDRLEGYLARLRLGGRIVNALDRAENASPQIRREVEEAVNPGKRMMLPS